MLAAGQIKASAITAKKRASDLVQGETFCMGRWPQSEVTSSSLLNALNKLSVSLWTYEYKYEASESSYKVIDMSFGDVAYGGEVYRKVVINQYRPCRTSASSSSSNSEQFDNGYYVGNTYWFRWDPINWVTIKIESDGVYVMSELLLDSQPYNDIFTSVNWEKCTIRKWLAKTFFQSAFYNKEKNCVLDYQRSSAVKDKIWLVSSTELSYSNLPGFFKDMKTSNYAKSQGLCVIIDDYNDINFIKDDGSMDLTTCVIRNSKSIENNFLNKIADKNTPTVINNNAYFTKEYFCPYNYINGELTITKNTYSIHWFKASWLPKRTKFKISLIRTMKKIFGEELYNKIFGKFVK